MEINKDIANGNFESDFARAWYTLKNTGTIEIVDNNVNTGNYAVKATVNTAGASYNLAVGTNLKIFLDENTDYVLSFYAKSENAAGKVKVALEYYDNSGTKIDTKYVNNETTSSYTQYNIDFTTPANTVYVKVKFMFSEVIDVIYLDDAKIEAKSTATAIKRVKEDSSVKVYPNPANDVLYVSGLSEVKNVEVCDLAGRKAIFVNEMAGDRIDVSSLKKGVYLVKVTTDSGTKVVKVVKK